MPTNLKSFFIGYLPGPSNTLYPEVFEDYTYLDQVVGLSYGSYVHIAGPFDTYNDALVSLRDANKPLADRARKHLQAERS